jgi:ribonuclease P protein component
MTDQAETRLRLSRSMRLQKSREFAQIREKGRRVAKGCLVANWVLLPGDAQPRLGVITTKKLGKAHERTRARRLLRETFRLHQHEFRAPVAMVLVARNSIVGRKRPDVERDFLAVLQQASLLRAQK